MFAGFTGAWLGLSLLKFGNPVILDQLIEPPAGFWEWVFNSWPVGWGYWMLAGLAIAGGATLIRGSVAAPRWLVILPLTWWGWQLLAATQTVDAALTRATMLHFTACIVCFYLGLIALSRVEQMAWFWMLLLAGFVWMLWMGFGQHFGGLESTLQMIYQQPDWRQLSPEYLKRVASNRIFSTLVYPNALAGAILLFLPMLVAWVYRTTARLANISRGVLVGLLGYAGLACLYWPGSKSGWLIALVLGLTGLLRLPLDPRAKVMILTAAMLFGLTGFLVKFSTYFRQGAPSVSARF